MRIGLLLFDQVDLLDVGGPYEVFLTANRLAARRGVDAPFEVFTIGVSESPIESYGRIGLTATCSVEEAGALDVLIVPGTVDIDTTSADEMTTAALHALTFRATLLTSVCTGSVLLARAGLLASTPLATTHHEDIGILAEVLGDRAVTARWVDAGAVVTAGGLSNGLAMALHLVDRLVDRDLAVATAAQIAYAWDPDDGILA